MKWLLSAFVLLKAFSCTVQKPSTTEAQEFVIQSVNVIPMDAERILHNQVVVVRDGKITAIGDAGKVNFNRNALVIDGRGKYLIPGLAEMHAHVPPVDDLDPMKEVLLLFAANGITTIRGMLGHPKHLELRSKINSGEILGPRFITSGPSFNGNSVKTPEQGSEMVRQQKQAGYDFLKLHPGLTKENFAAIASTAKELNIPFAGHVSFDVGVWRAIDAGYATIDHMDGFVEGLVPDINNFTEQQVGFFGMNVTDKADTTRIPALMRALKEKNIWVVPTQALAERWMSPVAVEVFSNAPEMIYMSANTRNNWSNSKKNLMNNPAYNVEVMNRYLNLRRKLIYESNKNGVGLLLGADAPQVFNVPGFSAHHELRYMVDAGLTPYEALKTATVNVGRFLNRNDLGVIKTGAVADLVLLNGNPLSDINETKNIEGVMLNGKWLSKSWINDTLKSLEKN
jgi:imidazolonepropionase-like amidohydrolase